MNILKIAVLAGATLAATAVFAHDGVKNPVVMARMEAMKTIGENMKVLAGMAKGQVAFDAAIAEAAFLAIAQNASQVPELFEAEEDDPKSEAAPEIWFDWADFIAKASDLEAVARASAASAIVTDQAGLGAALGSVGTTCKACHQLYKL